MIYEESAQLEPGNYAGWLNGPDWSEPGNYGQEIYIRIEALTQRLFLRW
jgi:hypothetical protein